MAPTLIAFYLGVFVGLPLGIFLFYYLLMAKKDNGQ
jgi:ABC-type nitrate/sulfonate/bicarbonate transport system permease component